MVNNPPAQFTQNYYSCYPKSLPSFQTAVGIASGNTTLSLPVLVFMVLPIIYFFMLKLNQVTLVCKFLVVVGGVGANLLPVLIRSPLQKSSRKWRSAGRLKC